MPGAPEFIPFTKELPKDTTSQKQKTKENKGPKPKGAAKGAAGAAAGAVEKVAEKLAGASV
jgi:seryl-tRNA synthetase